ncbi:hypothetical protein [Candidatus Phyllobacterium onerii]|uniref:hypothetical protein n=1 Tax=Candidatus Phyllobacterium onerii TaxID=3020828 RepID=UPI00232B6AEF|nr:hypothetical protein [Phyllobacterium sp. IY22]
MEKPTGILGVIDLLDNNADLITALHLAFDGGGGEHEGAFHRLLDVIKERNQTALDMASDVYAAGVVQP